MKSIHFSYCKGMIRTNGKCIAGLRILFYTEGVKVYMAMILQGVEKGTV